MISSLNLDTILSDPMLLVGAVCVIVGPVIFLIALVQWIRLRRSDGASFVIPEEEPEEPLVPSPLPSVPTIPPAPEEAVPPPAIPEPPPTMARPTPPPPPEPADAEKTMVMAPGVSDMQAQLSIAISQLKTLNKKVYDLESQIAAIADKRPDPLSYNELKEPPMNPADFTQKLLKLAEHVIVLEKEMARVRGLGRGEEPAPPVPSSVPTSEAPAPSKPPIMPL